LVRLSVQPDGSSVFISSLSSLLPEFSSIYVTPLFISTHDDFLDLGPTDVLVVAGMFKVVTGVMFDEEPADLRVMFKVVAGVMFDEEPADLRVMFKVVAGIMFDEEPADLRVMFKVVAGVMFDEEPADLRVMLKVVAGVRFDVVPVVMFEVVPGAVFDKDETKPTVVFIVTGVIFSDEASACCVVDDLRVVVDEVDGSLFSE